MGSHFLLQGIFPTQGSNPHLLLLILPCGKNHLRKIVKGLCRYPLFSWRYIVVFWAHQASMGLTEWIPNFGVIWATGHPLFHHYQLCDLHKSVKLWQRHWTVRAAFLSYAWLLVRTKWVSVVKYLWWYQWPIVYGSQVVTSHLLYDRPSASTCQVAKQYSEMIKDDSPL